MLTRLAAIALAVAAAVALPTPAAAGERTPQRTARTYLGTHAPAIGDGIAPRNRALGAVRLWDAGVTWRDLEPADDAWHWARLDLAVDTAEAAGLDITLVLGQTPAWAQRDPGADTIYGPGLGSFPSTEAAWVDYVGTVARRYAGRVDAYETWNEANLETFSSITPREMARLQSLAYRTVKAADPGAIVTAPSVTIRGGSGARFLLAFARAGGYRFAEVTSLHPYPRPEHGPEEALILIRNLKAALRDAGVRRPAWSTELNYGLPWGGSGLTFPTTDRQARAITWRTALLHRQAVGRTYLYAWMRAPYLGVTYTDGSPAAVALEAVADVMHAGRYAGCPLDERGRYTCTVLGAGERTVARWHPTRPTTVRAPAGTVARLNLAGDRVRFRPGELAHAGAGVPVVLVVR